MKSNHENNEEMNNDFYNDTDHEEYDEVVTGGLSVGQRVVGVLICLALLTGLIVAGVFLYTSSLKPVDPNNTTPEYITIEQGMTTSQVAQLLEDSHLVRNALVFQSYAGRHSYGGAEIQAATYELTQAMSVSEIYTKLINGDSYVGASKIVAIPEGLNINQVASIAEEAGVCTADEYLAEASDINKYLPLYPILDSIPVDEIPERTLEGYLFPDTYEIVGEGAEGAAALVQNQLTQFTLKYTDEMIQKTHEAGRTVDEIVILASIVELESKFPDDRPLVASVFYNRMAIDMPLQSDITIDYIYGTRTPVLTTEQTQIESPYNTYINLGLPLGPICSPGLASIEAAIEPAETNYLYFVADLETGQLYFNETLDEHYEDVETYLD